MLGDSIFKIFEAFRVFQKNCVLHPKFESPGPSLYVAHHWCTLRRSKKSFMQGKWRLGDTLCDSQNMVWERVFGITGSKTMFCHPQSVSSSRNFPGINLFLSFTKYSNYVRCKEEDHGFQILHVGHPHNSCGIP